MPRFVRNIDTNLRVSNKIDKTARYYCVIAQDEHVCTFITNISFGLIKRFKTLRDLKLQQ